MNTNNQNNMGNIAPEVTPDNMVNEAPVLENQQVSEAVTKSVVEDMDKTVDDAPSGDASDITFDYNEIYGVTENTEVKEENVEDNNLPVFDEKEVVIDENRLKRDTEDVVPQFRIDELEGKNTNKEDIRVSDEIYDDKEADKADTRRKITYILVIVFILLVFLWFIFPIMAGYKF